MSGALSPPMASTASEKGPVVTDEPELGEPAARRDAASDPDSAPQRLPGCNHFAPIVMAAMAAYVVRPLQFPTVGAFGVRLVRQRLMAAAHARARRGGLSLWNSHGTAPLL
jgi:hypothetical protein